MVTQVTKGNEMEETPVYIGELELRILEMIRGGTRPQDITDVIYKLSRVDGYEATREQVDSLVMSHWEGALLNDVKRSITDEVREYVFCTTGVFTTDDIRKALNIKTKAEYKNMNVSLNRLCGQEVIERVNGKNGQFRLMDKSEDEQTVFMDREPDEFKLWLPLQLNTLVKIYPKNIIIIAGSKSAGKTAFLLNIAMANQVDHEVVYFNSEMGDEEWTNRLRSFGIKSADQIKMKTPKRSANFHERIDGSKKIYIIDFLEIHENFYEVAKPIRLIHEKLRDGICIIAIQKDAKAELSRGGAFSAEKARLYLTLDYVKERLATKCTIYDAKVPRLPDGVKGMFRHVKIVGGWKLQVQEDWRR
jgi:hypothetical protein